ncbi:hypothetical protein DOY81_007148 [Sarcophaga bullata]|nr:hypothetical protein DOY81_007148 [Sarcophaga bullata]
MLSKGEFRVLFTLKEKTLYGVKQDASSSSNNNKNNNNNSSM